jgi:hypothetical protein
MEIENASVVLKGRESAKSSGENHTHEATRRNLAAYVEFRFRRQWVAV